MIFQIDSADLFVAFVQIFCVLVIIRGVVRIYRRFKKGHARPYSDGLKRWQ